MLLYFAIALVGALFLLGSVVLGEVLDFGDADGSDGDVHPLSGKTIAVALTAFGAAALNTIPNSKKNAISRFSFFIEHLL